MHIHIGVAFGAITFATVLVFGFFWRLIGSKLAGAGNSFGQAMLFIY